MLLASSAVVPMTMSTLPAARSRLIVGRILGADQARQLRDADRQPWKRALKVRKCWRLSSVVGTTTATWLPDIAATKAARSATSVLPKPTSPQISRSIGRPDARSPITSSMARGWSSVSG